MWTIQCPPHPQRQGKEGNIILPVDALHILCFGHQKTKFLVKALLRILLKRKIEKSNGYLGGDRMKTAVWLFSWSLGSAAAAARSHLMTHWCTCQSHASIKLTEHHLWWFNALWEDYHVFCHGEFDPNSKHKGYFSRYPSCSHLSYIHHKDQLKMEK